jgi:hypothetical protein
LSPERFAAFRDRVENRRGLSDEEAATLLEHCTGKPLPDWLNNYLIKRFRAEKRRPRGRPKENRTWLDFCYADAWALYQKLLPKYQAESRRRRADAKKRRRMLPKQSVDDGRTASERAWRDVAREMNEEIKNRGWKGWQNAISKWNADWKVDSQNIEYPEDPHFDPPGPPAKRRRR